MPFSTTNVSTQGKTLVRFFDAPHSEERNPERSHQKHQKYRVTGGPASLPPEMESCMHGGDTERSDSEDDTLCTVATLHLDAYYPFDERRQREPTSLPFSWTLFFERALDLGNRHFPLSMAALIGVLTWCVGLVCRTNIFQQNSSRTDAQLQPTTSMSTTMFCTKEKQIGHGNQRDNLNAFEICCWYEKV